MSDDDYDDECQGCICAAIRMAPCMHCEDHLDENAEPTCDHQPSTMVFHRNQPCSVTPVFRLRAPAVVTRDGTTWRWICRLCTCSEWRPRWGDAMTEVHEHLDRHANFGFKRGKR